MSNEQTNHYSTADRKEGEDNGRAPASTPLGKRLPQPITTDYEEVEVLEVVPLPVNAWDDTYETGPESEDEGDRKKPKPKTPASKKDEDVVFETWYAGVELSVDFEVCHYDLMPYGIYEYNMAELGDFIANDKGVGSLAFNSTYNRKAKLKAQEKAIADAQLAAHRREAQKVELHTTWTELIKMAPEDRRCTLLWLAIYWLHTLEWSTNPSVIPFILLATMGEDKISTFFTYTVSHKADKKKKLPAVKYNHYDTMEKVVSYLSFNVSSNAAAKLGGMFLDIVPPFFAGAPSFYRTINNKTRSWAKADGGAVVTVIDDEANPVDLFDFEASELLLSLGFPVPLAGAFNPTKRYERNAWGARFAPGRKTEATAVLQKPTKIVLHHQNMGSPLRTLDFNVEGLLPCLRREEGAYTANIVSSIGKTAKILSATVSGTRYTSIHKVSKACNIHKDALVELEFHPLQHFYIRTESGFVEAEMPKTMTTSEWLSTFPNKKVIQAAQVPTYINTTTKTVRVKFENASYRLIADADEKGGLVIEPGHFVAENSDQGSALDPNNIVKFSLHQKLGSLVPTNNRERVFLEGCPAPPNGKEMTLGEMRSAKMKCYDLTGVEWLQTKTVQLPQRETDFHIIGSPLTYRTGTYIKNAYALSYASKILQVVTGPGIVTPVHVKDVLCVKCLFWAANAPVGPFSDLPKHLTGSGIASLQKFRCGVMSLVGGNGTLLGLEVDLVHAFVPKTLTCGVDTLVSCSLNEMIGNRSYFIQHKGVYKFVSACAAEYLILEDRTFVEADAWTTKIFYTTSQVATPLDGSASVMIGEFSAVEAGSFTNVCAVKAFVSYARNLGIELPDKLGGESNLRSEVMHAIHSTRLGLIVFIYQIIGPMVGFFAAWPSKSEPEKVGGMTTTAVEGYHRTESLKDYTHLSAWLGGANAEKVTRTGAGPFTPPHFDSAVSVLPPVTYAAVGAPPAIQNIEKIQGEVVTIDDALYAIPAGEDARSFGTALFGNVVLFLRELCAAFNGNGPLQNSHPAFFKWLSAPESAEYVVKGGVFNTNGAVLLTALMGGSARSRDGKHEWKQNNQMLLFSIVQAWAENANVGHPVIVTAYISWVLCLFTYGKDIPADSVRNKLHSLVGIMPNNTIATVSAGCRSAGAAYHNFSHQSWAATCPNRYRALTYHEDAAKELPLSVKVNSIVTLERKLIVRDGQKLYETFCYVAVAKPVSGVSDSNKLLSGVDSRKLTITKRQVPNLGIALDDSASTASGFSASSAASLARRQAVEQDAKTRAALAADAEKKIKNKIKKARRAKNAAFSK